MRAEIAGTDEFDIRVMYGDIVAHRAFRQKHHAGGAFTADIVGHDGGGAGKIRGLHDIGRTFRMRQHGDAGMAFPEFSDVIGGEQFMHLAMAAPGDQFDIGFLRHVLCQIFIRQHQHARHAERFHHLAGIA
ncbi:hypothetical protein D3C86_1133380 [compost metagenome]